MGVVDVWKLISPSEKKFTLEQISVDTENKRKGKGLRVAIDIAIWTFQARSSVVGEGSELRQVFFRFNRLYELGIRPVFVFDGVNRPKYKRDKFINTKANDTVFRRNLILMVKHFNFSMWEAYGEAEAECAVLERLGFVDMVYTGDSDVFLFGARRVIRQWPSKKNEEISCYDLTWITDKTGLDRSDLILIALIRGCDYDTSGTQGVGTTVAAQLAKCHFHRALMDDIQLAGRSYSLDEERVQHLFDDIMYELHHNSCGNMIKKYHKVVLDKKFFDFNIVIDFIHPPANIVVRDNDILERAQQLKHNLDYYHEPNWKELAWFAQHTFAWPANYLIKRFSSLLFPGYMANRLRKQQPNYVYPPPKISVSSAHRSDSQQTSLLDYYRSTSRFHSLPDASVTKNESDLIQITGSKISKEKLKLYRVEWNQNTWKGFTDMLKQDLDFAAYKDTAVMDEELQEMNFNEKEDLFSSIKRQWVDALYVHRAYPSTALEYQGKLSEKAKDPNRQTKLESFLIIPPKRKIHIT